LLQNLLLKRQEELEGVLNSLEISEEQTRLKRVQSDLDGVNASLNDINTRQQQFEKKIEDNNKTINKIKNEIEDLKKSENEAQKRLQNESKNMERLLNKRSMLLQKREESLKKIRDIGSLPTEALEKFRDLTLQEMHVQLRDTKNNLKKYSSVNKKALDQYVNFTEQHEDLSNRKNELDSSKNAIDELVEELDHKKDEAIERTFKGVAKFFSEVFSELTSGGRANLIMQKPKGEKELEGPERIRSYRGVEVQVAFNPNAPEYQNMSQLSGGQQSLVALALIFAIQRCDPAPFYVFDEIDPALDDNHRHAVAAMIKKQSKVIQFITTSHRPELVAAAHKCYKITFTNRVSNIVSVEQEEALELIKEVEEEEDAQQEQSRSVNNASRTSRNRSIEPAQSEEEEAEGGEASDE
jgi:structural maintenance of chromosome 3 (chondroitin sulfate proteoglycan 6)